MFTCFIASGMPADYYPITFIIRKNAGYAAALQNKGSGTACFGCYD